MDRKRRIQSVSTVAQRKRVTLWLIQEVSQSQTSHRIPSKAVHKFQTIFNQPSASARRAKARDWWINREQFLSDLHHQNNGRTIITHRLNAGVAVQLVALKARKGRGRKRKPWVLMLQESLLEEFRRLQKLGVKMSRSIFKEVALQLVSDPSIEVTHMEIELTTGKPLIESISNNFIADFCSINRLVSRKRSGNLTLSIEATKQLIEKWLII